MIWRVLVWLTGVGLFTFSLSWEGSALAAYSELAAYFAGGLAFSAWGYYRGPS